MKKNVTNHGNFILSAELVSKKDCKDIIKFIDTHEKEHSTLRDYSEKNRNTNSKEIILSQKLNLPNAQKIDDIIFKRVGEAINKFIVQNIPNGKGLMSNLQDTGYQLRKIIGPTLQHADGVQVNILSKSTYNYRIGTLIISLKDTGDEIVFPHLDLTVPLKQGTILFFPPYWTHVHYSNWAEQEGYRIQTWLTNTKDIE